MNDPKGTPQKPLDGEMKGTGPIVHMRADSDSLLESMFQFALKPAGSEMPANYKPYRMRKLPDSFFKPPPVGTKSPSCHSRENSHDSTSLHDPYSPASMNVGSPQQPQNQQPQRPPPSHSVSTQLQPHHSRAHSSPATLQPANLVAINIPISSQQQQQQPQPEQPQQMQQAQQQIQQVKALIHYITVLFSTLRITQKPNFTFQKFMKKFVKLKVKISLQQHHHHRQASLDVNFGSSEDVLPEHWDKAMTENGQVFYRNHNKKTTQWDHPLPALLRNLGPMPPRWGMGVTNESEIYFMNHNDRSTTWYDPRLPQSQQPQIPHRIIGEGTSTPHPGGQPLAAQPNQIIRDQNQQRLQMLLNKKHSLNARQEELARQVRLQNQRVAPDLNIAQEMLMRHSLSESGSDPFLTQNNQAEIHNRQESADSGLGMGSNFNLGSIPEDISGIESMDTGDLDTTLTGDNTNVASSTARPDTVQDHLLTSLPSDLGEMSTDLMESFLETSQQGNDPNNPNPIWL